MSATAIVCSADSGYFWLLQGLVLSLEPVRPRHDVVVLDIGLDGAQTAWLAGRGAKVVPMPDDLPMPRDVPSRVLAQVCRPYLPRIVPGYDALLWMDADTWVQTPEAVDLFFHLALRTRSLVAVPEIHHAYLPLLTTEQSHEYARLKRGTALRFGGEELWQRVQYLPWINCGVVAARADCDIWDAWARALASMIEKKFTHLLEQAALMVAVLDGHRPYYLPAPYNWLCSFTLPRRDAGGDWCTPFALPSERVHVMHLAQSSKADYRGRGMLFRGGAYLDEPAV